MAYLRVCLLLCLTLQLVAGADDEIREPPKIKKPVKDTIRYVNPDNPIESKKLTLECKAEGKPSPTFSWQKDGQSLTNTADKYTIDKVNGNLTILNFKKADNGEYRCVATSQFQVPSGPMDVKSLSSIITLKMIEIDFNNIREEINLGEKEEYQYLKLACQPENGYAVAKSLTWNWYDGGSDGKSDQMKLANYQGRLYQDSTGDLHFLYLLEQDAPQTFVRCSYFITDINNIGLFTKQMFTVKKSNIDGIQPTLQYKSDPSKNQDLKVPLHSNAHLECVFQGYDPSGNSVSDHIPTVKWFDINGEIDSSNNEKYEIEGKGNKLMIKKVSEEDEGDYYCQGIGYGESVKHAVTLDITSPPLFKNTEDRPQPLTIPEGQDAVFNCNSYSLKDEEDPQLPKWYMNGLQIGDHTDLKYKYLVSNGGKTFTVTSVNKDTDIMCVQCSVRNQYGTTWEDACLNVILAIEITSQPDERQEINHGDIITLTTEATTDASQENNLNKIWTFNGTEYSYKDLPFAESLPGGGLQINTSKLTEEQYEKVQGVYKLEIKHTFERKEVQTEVILIEKPTPAPIGPAKAGFPMWIIIVIVAIIVLIIIVAIIVCCVCKKQQEGDYNVDKKEVGAGLDPKKELMEKGFDDYSRPNLSDYEDVPRQPLPYDEDVPLTGDDQKSLGEYSEDDEARLGFNEDGSFIGQYYKKDPNHVPSSDYEYQTSQNMV